MYGAVKDQLAATLAEIEEAGLYKRERELTTAQSSHVATTGGAALNFCANNYLGFADHPDVVGASKDALDEWGFGMASVRFICGTQTQHTLLEERLSAFLGAEATILYSSCFDANGGVFEVLFGAEDAIVSDELNHASIIDGVRLSKAARYRYRNADMADLRTQLEAARAAGRGGSASSPTASSRWTAPTPRSTRSATSPTSSRRWSSSTTATRWASSATEVAARPSCSACSTASTSSPARWARPWAGRPAATCRATGRSSSCCASARARTCSPTPSRRRSSPGRSRRSSSCRGRARRARRCAATPRSSAS